MFNIKPNGHYQSCLVAKGFSQVKGIDFDELFSSVVHYETAQLLLAVAILKDLDIQSIDIKTAYLSQTSFGHISTNSLMIPTVSKPA